jgi:hydroxyethylthiazole kinase-like uncharacterized protein yjeF
MRSAWVAAGPGNNGGDGLVAARLLQRAGVQVRVSLVGDTTRSPADARRALDDARQAGVQLSQDIAQGDFDLSIDALLGLGGTRAASGPIAAAIAALNRQTGLRLAVDLPSGLNADTGQPTGDAVVTASHTLSLLTLKPGLFTGHGRDHAGQIWLDRLGVEPESGTPQTARLLGAADAVPAQRPHASHKGSFGNVAVVGGAPGMVGAAWLAARGALGSGAGRVFVALLDPAPAPLDSARPELMLRPLNWLADPTMLARCTVVCGCGGGDAVRQVLPTLLARSARLVLDADALNALAADAALLAQLDARARRGQPTVLTPHPLEAARLLGTDSARVQADRLRAARELSLRHGCVLLLKGSGSVVAAPDGRIAINPSGNALLAAGGSGDVLAGWIAGRWAQSPDANGDAAYRSTLAATWLHGHSADRVLVRTPHLPALRAADLIEAMRDAAGAAA